MRKTVRAQIDAFVVARGHADAWDYLTAHPRLPLYALAAEIEGVSGLDLADAATVRCVAQHAMDELVLDFITRGLHSELPGGWGSGSELDHRCAMSGGALPDPYVSILNDIVVELVDRRPPPAGWLPTSRDDERLRGAYRRALAGLPEASRRIAEANEVEVRPGALLRNAIMWVAAFVDLSQPVETLESELRRARPEELHLFAAQVCQSEVCNGGFHQFFCNGSGAMAPEAVNGFAAIGMAQCASIVGEAMRHFGAPYPRERTARNRALPRLPGRPREEWDPFVALDERFYAVIRDENGGFEAAADRYVAEGAV